VRAHELPPTGSFSTVQSKPAIEITILGCEIPLHDPIVTGTCAAVPDSSETFDPAIVAVQARRGRDEKQPVPERRAAARDGHRGSYGGAAGAG